MTYPRHPVSQFVRGCKVTYTYVLGTYYYTLTHSLGTLRPIVQIWETDESPVIQVPDNGLFYTLTVVDKNSVQLHVEEATAATGRTFDAIFLAVLGR